MQFCLLVMFIVVERPFMFQWFIDDWILFFDVTCSQQLSAIWSIFPDSYSGNLRYNDNNKTKNAI